MIREDKIAELEARGFCVLKAHFPSRLVNACAQAFEPILREYLTAHAGEPNRGPFRHFLPMPFQPPCFAPEFFFDPDVLSIVRGVVDDRLVADQWGCDVPLAGSDYQAVHVDYRRPLFAEAPDLLLPTYMLVVSFGLADITPAHGPIEIAPGTHRMTEALRSLERPGERAVEHAGERAIELQPVPLEIGDVLLRHPWALHRGSPNITGVPRPLATIRYVRRWYADDSREVRAIPRAIWKSLTPEQQSMMRFPLE